jgi:hypothetical protein
MILGAAAAAVCIAVTVSLPLWETDFWQHLLVGKVIWQQHRIPTTHLWSWPTYGALDVNASWGFRALIWPVWKLGGIWGLYVWRWATTLGAFSILWAASRRMGARDFLPLFVLVLCALTYSIRANIRPETLVSVLFALQIWILETRRSGGPDRTLWLIPLAWVWANAHISYYLGLALICFHIVDDLVSARRPGGAAVPRRGAGRLAFIAAAALGISFVNPWGWRALWQPFQYFFFWRNETIYRTIIELRPLTLQFLIDTARSGFWILLVGWPVLLLWRIKCRGVDVVELMVCAAFTAFAFFSTRFAGFYALAAAPYLARDLHEWAHGRRALWHARPFVRAGLLAVLALVVCVPEWSWASVSVAARLCNKCFPERACDFMMEHDIGGRGFNQFDIGGYMLWRFWPDRERLPFMDIHQSGTREEQKRYVRVFSDPRGWPEIDERYHFDYALLDASEISYSGDRSLDALDADSSFALVFRDDAAALYVKRSPRFAALIEKYAYRFVPGGDGLLDLLNRVCRQDSFARAITRSELERQIGASPRNARALSLLANIESMDRRYDEARACLERAVRTDPTISSAHRRLGLIALIQHRPADAVRELERARKEGAADLSLYQALGSAYKADGDVRKARKYYELVIERSPANTAARDSLRRLEAPGGN